MSGVDWRSAVTPNVDAAVVGEDRDSHRVLGGQRHERLDLAQPCAEREQRRSGARVRS